MTSEMQIHIFTDQFEMDVKSEVLDIMSENEIKREISESESEEHKAMSELYESYSYGDCVPQTCSLQVTKNWIVDDKGRIQLKELAEPSSDITSNNFEFEMKVKTEPSEIEEVAFELCGEQLPDADTCAEHLKSHTDKKNPCADCGQEFSNRRTSNAHTDDIHARGDDAKCPSQKSELHITVEPLLSGHPEERPPALETPLDKLNLNMDVLISTLDERPPLLKGHLSDAKGVDSQEGFHGTSDQQTSNKFECSVCGISFKSEKKKVYHMVQHEASLNCETCGKTFPVEKKDKYLSHIKIHRKTHMCGTCGKGFTAPSKLEMHEATHTGHKPKDVICDLCGRGFWNKKLYRRHLATHGIGHERFNCEVCGKEIYSRLRLTAHMVTHKERTEPCSFCGKLFHTKRDVRIHERTHTGEKPYQCGICDRRFATLGPFRRHSDFHANKKRVCAICKKKFSSQFNLARHLAVHVQEIEDSNEDPDRYFVRRSGLNLIDSDENGVAEEKHVFHCEFCDQVFKIESNLKTHCLSHASSVTILIKKKFQCKFCDKIYASKRSLDSHLTEHSGEKPFECEECGLAFSTKHLSKRHSLTTHPKPDDPVKSLPCLVCGKIFQNTSNLQAHVKTHTDWQPFQCSVCGKQFRQKAHLDTHVRIHTGERPFMCPHCGGTYTAASTLRNHMRNIHGESGKKQINKGRSQTRR